MPEKEDSEKQPIVQELNFNRLVFFKLLVSYLIFMNQNNTSIFTCTNRWKFNFIN